MVIHRADHLLCAKLMFVSCPEKLDEWNNKSIDELFSIDCFSIKSFDAVNGID